MAVVGGGAQATLAFVDESHALAVPASLPWTEAGGFPEVFSTAYDALFTQAGLAMGERVLVSARQVASAPRASSSPPQTGAVVVATVRDPGAATPWPRSAPTWSSRRARRRRTAPTTSCSNWSARRA